MSAPPGTSHGAGPVADATDGPRRRRRRRSSRGRIVALVVVVVLVLVAVCAGWLFLRGRAAQDHLESARDSTDLLREQLLDQQNAEAAQTLVALRSDTARAHELTSDPVWRVAAKLPFVGDDLEAVTTTTAAVDDVAQEVLPALVETADALGPRALRAGGARIDLAPLAAAAPQLAAAQQRAADALAELDGIGTEGLTGPVASAVTTAQDGLGELNDLTTNAADAARLLPSMLGGDEPRRYFVAFQSNAEARGTGGLIGAYAVLEAKNGVVRVRELGPRTALDPGNRDEPAVDFGADYAGLYGDDPGWWVNTNMSPHFPYAAQLWASMYEEQTGTRIDGAIATDPVALGYVLGATGAVTLDNGTRVDASNAARLTMRDVYARYPKDDTRRDAFLQQVARATVQALLTGKGDSLELARALGKAAGEGRLAVWSADREDQAVLATTPLGGSVAAEEGIPSGATDAWTGVYLNAAKASKLDYYLRADATYALGSCTDGDERSAVLTLNLTNTAPRTGLPKYVTGTGGPGKGATNLDVVAVHLPVGAVVERASRDGDPLGVSPHELLGRPVVTFPVTLEPGQTARIRLDLSQPAVQTTDARLVVQPLATPATTRVSGPDCGR